MDRAFLAELRRIAGARNVLGDALELLSNECDAPDPSSQQVCSIGGNVAENSGGAHCLKYGFTVHHVLGVEAILPNGDVVHIGGSLVDTPGPDLLGLIVGSEGTLAIVTSITV